MSFPWEILIAFVVLLAAYVLNSVYKDMLEDEKVLYRVVGGFFVLYALAAVGIWMFSPTYDRPANIASIVDQLTHISVVDTGF